MLSLAQTGVGLCQNITNGSFEDPVVSSASPGATLFNSSNPLPGWQMASKTGDILVLTSAFKGQGDAFHKEQYAANVGAVAASSAADSVIFQTVSGFAAGQTYELNYALADCFGGDGIAGSIDVLIFDDNGKLAFSQDSVETKNGYCDEFLGGSSATDWVKQSLTFVPTSKNVTFSFDFSTGTQSQVFSAALDGVSLSQVPEPSAALLGSLGALALLRRRRA
jgi:hypothetical protein